MRLPKDLLLDIYTSPQFFLCEVDKEKICKLEATNRKASLKFNSLSELSFDVARVYNDVVTGETRYNPFFDKIEALRLILVENVGYFELQGPEMIGDGVEEKKSCTAYSLEYILSQKFLTNFNVNTGKVDSLEVLNATNPDKIVPIVLYDPTNKNLSLLHLALEKVYGWRIGHVDKQLQTLSRQFEIERESVYDFLMNEVCEKFNCYVVFDTFENTINLYAESPTAKFIGNGVSNIFKIGSKASGAEPFSTIETVSIDGYKTTRWSYTIVDNEGILVLEEAPSGGAMIEVVGTDSTWETDVFISYDNLSQEINVNYDADSIKTVLTVTYGDDEDIRETNLGLPYLTDLSFYYTVDWMGQDLYDAYTAYLEKSNSSQTEYTNNSKEILKINDQIYYEENRLSLEYSMVDVDSSTVGTYYTRHKNADGSYYYTEVSLPSEYIVGASYYSNASTNVQDGDAGNVAALYTAIKKYFYNYFRKKYQDERNEQDEIYESYATGMDEAIQELKDLRDRFSFAETYTINSLANDLQNGSDTKKEQSIRQFLDNIWVEIGRTPLKQSYLATYETIQKTNADWSNPSHENYGLYYPVTIFVDSIKAAIGERDKKIEEHEDEKEVFQLANKAISDSLLMTNNFTSQQLIKLNAFLREDELHIDDIVETSLDNLSSSFKLKQDAMESGRIELKKLCQPQLQFTMDMANIYALTEFESIVDKFQLGNIIKIKLRDAYTETFNIVGDGATVEFMVPPAFDGIKRMSIKANCSYNAQTGKLIFDTPPKNGEVIGITLARYYIKQSRLLQVDINFDDFSDFSCEFGELTSLRTQSDIHADLLRNAISAGKSVASNSNYWTKGSDQATATDLKIQQGLLDATTQIKATDGTQGVVIDKYGIKLQKYDSSNGIDPHQTWLVNNMILMTDDGWKTSRAGLGEFTVDGVTFYGLIAEAVLSGYIEGSKIVGGELYSTNYSGNVDAPKGTYMNLNTGDFELASGKMIYDAEKGTLTFNGVTIEWSTTDGPSISDIDGLEARLGSLESSQGGSGYDDSKIKEIDKAVAEHLGLGGGTVLTEDKIISPYIGGGYLNITNTDNNSRVVIDPNNLTGNNYIFQVHNGDKVTVGVTAEGNAEFSGTITSASMIGGSIQSTNYERNVNGTYIGLDDGYFEVGGGSLVYSDNVITLGKQTGEDSESIIKLCGGLGEISFTYDKTYTTERCLEISSDKYNVDIFSSKRIVLDCRDGLDGVFAYKTRLDVYNNYIDMISYYDGDGDGVYDESSSSFNLSYNSIYLSTPKLEFNLRDHVNEKWHNILFANVSNDTTEQSLTVGNNIGYTYIDGNHVSLRVANNSVRLRNYNSDAAVYNAFFEPMNIGSKTIALGTTANPWYAVYANSSTIQTSDIRKKTNIIPLGENQISTFDLRDHTESIDLHSELFDRLQPVQYNFINDESRIHYGLVAQDVVAAMDELGIGENELDLVHHDYWIDEITGEEKESYGLAYNNLIAMLIHEVQKLKQQ